MKLPIRVTSLDPESRFSELCETLVVSAHGCAFRFPVQLDAGSALRLHSRGGRQATAYVVFCQPMEADGEGFRLGARLDKPQNLWGLDSCPADWQVLEMPAPTAKPQKSTAISVVHKPQARSQASQAVLDKIEEQLSEERLRGILGRLVRPMQDEVVELREKLSANAKRNRFEVSLGYIPPELEEKLWERLRQDLGTRVLQQAREQSAEILGAAKASIDQKIGEALTEYRHRLSGELHAVEQRAEILSRELTASTQQHVRSGIEKLQRQALDNGAHLNVQSEKLLKSLQGQLADTHNQHRQQIEDSHADAVAKAAEIKSEVSDLSRRIAVLNESVRRLESELDAHLESVAREIVTGAAEQLENAVDGAFKDLQTRGSNEIESRINEICGHLRTIQNRIETSFTGSLKSQGEEAVQTVAEEFNDVAQQSLEKWRLSLTRDLSCVAKTLGQQLRDDLEPEVSAN